MKLKVSRPSQKKNFFPLQFDNTTTMGFGFVQPLSCTELVPQSSVDLSCASFVRLAPLATPTYGRCNLHHYTCFVPASEVYHPWDSFLSSSSYNGGGVSYVPTSVPYTDSRFLTLCVLFFSSCRAWVPSSDGNLIRFYPTESEPNDSVLRFLFEGLGYLDAEEQQNLFSFFRAIYPVPATYFSSEAGDDFDAAKDGFDYTIRVPHDNSYIVFTWRFSDFSKNLRSILIGLGYQLNCTNVRLSFLPVMAYYRAYFELFYPKRFLSYQDSSLFKLIEAFEYHNNMDLFWFVTNPSTVGLVPAFLKDLVMCYYTSQSDYVSLHHSGVAINPVSQSVNSIRPNGNFDSVSASVNQQASINFSSNIGGSKLRVLQWLTKYVNKRTYLGGKIDEILRSQYDSSSECGDSFLIDSFITPIEISDVMNQAETSEGVLGEYAGKGVGFNLPRSAKYRAKEFGFLIHFAAIVPQSGYSQAVDPCLGHVSKFDYYTPGLDGLTLVPTRKMFVYGVSDFVSPDSKNISTSTFGNIPIYSEYKFKYSILNGDISMASTRTSFLPYTMDKLLPYIDPVSRQSDVENIYKNVVNGTLWRYVGLYRWLGMYDRVFVNTGISPNSDMDYDLLHYSGGSRLDDNFICHNHFKLSLHAPMLSFGSSFDTGADDLGSDSQISSSGE